MRLNVSALFNRLSIPLLGAFSVLAIASMTSAGCVVVLVEGSGVHAKQTRELPSFREVHIEGAADRVDVYVCECERVEVSGDDNLLDHVETTVEGDALLIQTQGTLRPWQTLHVKVYTRQLDRVHTLGDSQVRVMDLSGTSLEVFSSGSSSIKLRGELERLALKTSGASQVDMMELQTQLLRVESSGSSDFTLRGVTERLELISSGASDIKARGLEAQHVQILSSGAADIEVCAQQSLRVTLSGSGDVAYDCEPESVQVTVSGSGRVRGR